MRLCSQAITILLLYVAYGIAQTTATSSASWISVGPEGGDVRTLSVDPANPSRLLLGTSAGQIYESQDGGKSWQRSVRIGKGSDFVIDHIIFDAKQPGIIYVAAWTIESEGGSVFKSMDNGQTWRVLPALEGKSVRALAIAPGDSKTLVAGTLEGVYRTRNGGQTWDRISPETGGEIKNIESIAIDPIDSNVIYVGTWHLPWKTADGGKSWHNIKSGIIDDSDVFSIIIDPRRPDIVYASACSGIYKSESAGELFHKIQGIPFSARRTRVLKQDPGNSNVVYAGTTEGLWKTSDAGATWGRITPANVIVNDVVVDAANSAHVLLATDRAGILVSNNAGVSFEPSNAGFAHRQVASVVEDLEDQNTLYAGVINDKEYGGVFVSHDEGAHWKQISAGLDGRDVFALRKSGTSLLAGTSSGVFLLNTDRDGARCLTAKVAHSGRSRAIPASHSADVACCASSDCASWRPINRIANVRVITVRKATTTRKGITRKVVKTAVLTARVTDIDVHDGKWIVASPQGLFTSSNMGQTWEGGPMLGHSDFTLVRSTSNAIAGLGRNFLLTSADGQVWREAKLPKIISSIREISFTKDAIWLACREGLYRSRKEDDGETWERMQLPVVNLTSVFYDRQKGRLLVTAMNSTEIFFSEDNGQSWQHRESGWLLRSISEHAGHLLASTAFDGVVVEKQPAAERADASEAGQNR
ncbi:MAG TPA: YCF48-related protein [Terriglobales bacterium]|nr:YCF48-related protein [Terriglobales bacterium]